jgi:chemotaxis signal transduction protein
MNEPSTQLSADAQFFRIFLGDEHYNLDILPVKKIRVYKNVTKMAKNHLHE